jgi:hypothetical protein
MRPVRRWYIAWRSEEHYGSPAVACLEEVPVWAAIVSGLADRLCLGIHFWCAPSDWTFSVPIRSLERDEYGYLEHSLGTVLFGSFQWLTGREVVHAKRVVDFPLTAEWCAEHGFADALDDSTEGAGNEATV